MISRLSRGSWLPRWDCSEVIFHLTYTFGISRLPPEELPTVTTQKREAVFENICGVCTDGGPLSEYTFAIEHCRNRGLAINLIHTATRLTYKYKQEGTRVFRMFFECTPTLTLRVYTCAWARWYSAEQCRQPGANPRADRETPARV